MKRELIKKRFFCVKSGEEPYAVSIFFLHTKIEVGYVI